LQECYLANSMKKTFYAYAKLNISLDVLGKMDNGYHEMQMVMQSIDLCDDVDIAVKPGDGKITVSTNKVFLPTDKNNSAWKAASLFLQKAKITDGDVDIKLTKRIPVCAGMAGGSTDAAAVLRGLNELFNAGFSKNELEKIGEEIGSDVPYCVAGGTVLAEGRGEILKDLPQMPKCYILVCKPKFSVSTPELFAKIDCSKIKCRPDTQGIICALEQGDIKGIGRRVYNVFENVLPTGKEDIAFIKNKMYDYSALGACMTGTGSAVYGLYCELENAQKAYEELKKHYAECFVTETTDKLNI